MSGGGSAPAQPSTTTQIQDIPEWEQGYVTDLLGQAQTIAAQPYQQFQGPQIAGFTPNQLQAFSNIENMGSQYQPTQNAALSAATQGANTANSIYGAGAGLTNAATAYNPLQSVAPYLGAAAGYNSAAAAQPWLNQAASYQTQAANAGTPQGIQSYMSPYTNDVVNGIQNEANLNWSQNIMPGVNDKFIGSGQYGSGRNAQVLGQAAGNFQTGLSANIANALQSGYGMAATQANNQANLLSGLGSQALSGANTASNAQGAQVSNLLNQAQAVGTATQQQAGNLLSAGQQLGNLAATQGTEQLAAGANLQNLANSQQANALTDAQSLQAVGQQQQQLNQTNLNTAMQDWQNQTNWPKEQTEYLNQIIRGLPAPTSTTSSSQTTPAYSVSPLAGLGGAGAGALSLLGSNGQQIGTALKKGGVVKGYADGGIVDDYDDEAPDGYVNPLDYVDEAPQANVVAEGNIAPTDSPVQSPLRTPQSAKNPLDLDTPSAQHNNKNPNDKYASSGVLTQSQMQQNQLLALARGLLTPSLNGSVAAAVGQGFGNIQEIQSEQQKAAMNQANINYNRDLDRQKLDLEKEKMEQGKYTPVKDFYGNVTGMVEGKTGKYVPLGDVKGSPNVSGKEIADEGPSSDPQIAAQQILDETGTPFTPVATRQDITGRNAQAKAYRDAAMAAKKAQQELDSLNAQTGKYTPGSMAGKAYSAESAIGMGGKGATARTEADKAAKNLANAFMQANAGAKGAGIRMVEFDAGAVPNPDMTDEARNELVSKQRAVANSQIQRGVISDMYPRMHVSNVNAIMDNYEEKNPPVLPSGSANPKWMSYKEWLKAGRPNTASMASKPTDSGSSGASNTAVLARLLAEKARREQGK